MTRANPRNQSRLARRPLGQTGEQLALIGFGGIVVAHVPQDEANQRVAAAVQRGVNYFDVAPSYGNAEEILGPALEPWREQVFLSCKTTQRGAEGAREELKRSLERLRTDHFDLYNLHAITTQDDIDQAFGPGGAMETFVQAKAEGKIRFLGFSAHSPLAAREALARFPFDAFIYPVNWNNDLSNGFSDEPFLLAQEHGCGVIALKALGHRPWEEGEERTGYGKCWYKPVTDRQLASLALRYTLSKPVTLAIPPGEPELFELAVELGQDFRPITDAELEELKARAGEVAAFFGG